MELGHISIYNPISAVPVSASTPSFSSQLLHLVRFRDFFGNGVPIVQSAPGSLTTMTSYVSRENNPSPLQHLIVRLGSVLILLFRRSQIRDAIRVAWCVLLVRSCRRSALRPDVSGRHQSIHGSGKSWDLMAEQRRLQVPAVVRNPLGGSGGGRSLGCSAGILIHFRYLVEGDRLGLVSTAAPFLRPSAASKDRTGEFEAEMETREAFWEVGVPVVHGVRVLRRVDAVRHLIVITLRHFMIVYLRFCSSISDNVRLFPLMFVKFRQCSSISVNVCQIPPIAVCVRFTCKS